MMSAEDELMLDLVDETLSATPGIETQEPAAEPETQLETQLETAPEETEEDRVVLNPEAELGAKPKAKKTSKPRGEPKPKAQKKAKTEKTEKKEKKESRKKEPKPPKIRRPYKSVETKLLAERFKKTHKRFQVCKERFERMQHKINMYENEFKQRDIHMPTS